MTYIKLLTALTALALLTACGGGTADKAGGDTTDCKANPFHADCLTNNAPALLLRQNMCLTNDAIHSTCDEVIVGVCMTNPFQSTACLPDDTYLSNRIAACIKYSELDREAKGNCTIVTNNTTMNPALIACLANPFDTACEASESAFSTYAETAQTNLASFCDDSDNATDDLCTGESQMRVCGFDPFTAICPDATYLSVRLDECIMAGNTGNTKCNTVSFDATMNIAITDCLENPFATACESVTAFMSDFADARTNRVTFCEANDSNALCIGANLMTICVFDPFSTLCTSGIYLTNRQVQCAMNTSTHMSCPTLLGGLADASDLPTYPALPATTRPTGFLEGTETGIDTTGFTLATTSQGETLGSGSLNATATAGEGTDMVSLGGLATDGVAWADIDFPDISDTNDGGRGFYAGIFSGTNMGAPLVKPTTDPEATVAWKGIIQGTGNTGATSPTPFTLNVDLFKRTLETFLPFGTAFAFSIAGNYDANGIIGGTVLLGLYIDRDIADQRRLDTIFASNTGTLTGLIGAKGAVAAFHSNDAASGYAGGFIVNNPDYTAPTVVVPDNPAVVEYNDWLAIGETVATPSTPVKNEFISGITTTGIRDGDGMLTHLNFGHLTLSNAKYKGVAFGGDDNDGFSPVYGDGANVYVGILPTTNLGAPLTQTTASAVWQAVLWANHKRISENGSFTPTIDFTAKTMTGTIADRAMDDTDFAVVDGNTFPRGVAYSFTASFDNPRGQLTGTITRTVSSVSSAGTIRGIIGEEGAVAGFISNGTSTDLSYTGGFVARPTPSE